MSRPQFHQYASSPSSAQGPVVVNGGLIDFQDNMQRGVSEYITPQQLLAAQGYPPGFVQPASLAAVNGSVLTAGTSAVPGAFQQGGGASYSAQGYPGMAQGVSGSCFSGPPSFLHVNGITYKPVEADPGIRSAASLYESHALASGDSAGVSTAGGVVASSVLPPPSLANARVLTEEDLHQAIDQRVQTKVERYLSSQRRPQTRSYTAVASERPRTASSSSPSSGGSRQASSTASSSSATRRAVSADKMSEAEALAVQRVKSANANMVKASQSGRGGRVSNANRW